MRAEPSGPTFDRLLAVVLLLFLSPFLIVRSVVAFVKTGAVLERQQVNTASGSIEIYKLSGFFIGRNLGVLFNVARGDIVLVGDGLLLENMIAHQRKVSSLPPNKDDSKPCLINLEKVQRISGTEYEKTTDKKLTIGNKVSVLLRFVLIKLIVPKRSYTRPDQFSVLNVPIDNVSLDEAVNSVIDSIKSKTKSRMAFVNADCLNIAYKNSQYLNALHKNTKVFADGVGLQIGAQILGVELNANVNGTDMLPRLCERCIECGSSIYLLGGKPGVAEEASETLMAAHPGLKIAGMQHGYFPKESTNDVIEKINQSGADIVLVAFGAPMQELWIEQYADQLTTFALIGVGGLLDFQTKRISRSPKWVQDIGMEWVWRLKQEPVRLWKRYVIGNPLFLYRVRKQAKSDHNCVNYKRFSNPHREIKQHNKRYIRQQYIWLFKFQLSKIGKRVVDFVGSGSALLLFSPLLLIVALLIKLESPGSVLFRQKRVGRYGQTFEMLKFRSMRMDAEKLKTDLLNTNEVDGGVIFKMKQDPRITRVGKYLRKYSIDELPQLINVLRGDMSLVGPRPSLTSEVDLYTGRDRRRLEVVPGITGLWQVSGRSDTTFEQQVDLDIDYLESRGIINDVLILVRTVPAVLSGRGAY